MNHRPTYQEALRRTGLLRILAPFDPHVVGTLTLSVARPDSDIDIVCCTARHCPSSVDHLPGSTAERGLALRIYQ